MQPSDSADPLRTFAADSPKERILGSTSSAEATQAAQTISTPSSVASDLCGKTLGVYEILGKLGEGGMGAVYKARHIKLDKLIALKILPAHLLREPAALVRFEREMRALGKLTHPNLVQAFDAGEANGIHYLALELVEGGDLSQLVKKRGPQPVWIVCRLIRQAALALDYAHRQGLVHRDIKPSNLMLTKAGQLKVSDLGLASLGQDDGSAPPVTSTGTSMGTPDYMAPEQWENTHTVDGRADLYSLGCTFFFLLTGRAPWQTAERSTIHSKMKGHLMDAPPDLKALRPDVPDDVNAICVKLLAKTPQDRYRVGAELAQALAPFSAKPEAHAATSVAASSMQQSQPNEDVQLHPNSGDSTEGKPLKSLLAMQTTPVAQHYEAPERTSPPRKFGNGHGKSPLRLLALGGGLMVIVFFGVIIFRTTYYDGTTSKLRVQGDPKAEAIRSGNFPVAAKNSNATTLAPTDVPALAISPFNAAQAKRHQEEWAAYLKLPVEQEIELAEGVMLALVLIPPGEFMMGSPDAEQAMALEEAKTAKDAYAIDHIPSERPQHRVRITQPFYLGKHEITQAQWKAVMGSNPSKFAKPGTEPEFTAKIADRDTSNYPVETVSWHDVWEFCAKLNKRENVEPFVFGANETVTPLLGNGFQLPTEAQWEFACRAGTTTRFFTGESAASLLRVAWIDRNSGGRLHEVGELPPNNFGLFDVHGNVWEWCEDWWARDFYAQSPTDNPSGPDNGLARAFRGGCFIFAPRLGRSAYRDGLQPTFRDFNLGFRVARVPSGPASKQAGGR